MVKSCGESSCVELRRTSHFSTSYLFFIRIKLILFASMDAKFGFDDNADFRQKDVFKLRDTTQEDPQEVEAAEVGQTFLPFGLECASRFTLMVLGSTVSTLLNLMGILDV